MRSRPGQSIALIAKDGKRVIGDRVADDTGGVSVVSILIISQAGKGSQQTLERIGKRHGKRSRQVFGRLTMIKRILAFLLCFALMEVALAHPPGTGSVSYAHDLKPMIDKNPLLAELLKENFSIANDMAMGTRIGDETAPAIDGARIGPYYVDAVWHSKHGNKPVSLTIYTDVQFFDASGKLLGNDFHNATRIVETFSGISIEEPDD